MASESESDIELIDVWVQKVFDSSKNIASKDELKEQAVMAFRNFRLADKDSNGTISFDELLLLCNRMGLPLEGDEEEELLKLDADGSGVLELEEWVLWWLHRVSCLPNPLAQQEALARNAFSKFDTDNSGTIDINELNRLFFDLGATLSQLELSDALLLLDLDSSGLVEIEEFVAWWTNRMSSKRCKGLIALKLKKLAAKATEIYNSDVFRAVWENDIELVRAFISADSRIVNASDKSDYGAGWMPLHYAAYQGYICMVEVLLSNGAKVNGVNDAGFTPIFYAAQQESIEICRLLIASGADPFTSGKYFQTNSSPAGNTQETLSACAVDVSVFNKEIVSLFKTHPKYQPPKQLLARDIAVSLSTKGVLTVDLPPQRTFRIVPVREWAIQLTGSCVDQDALEAKGAESNFEMTIPAKIPSDNQSITVAIQKTWMKFIFSLGSKAELSVKIAAIDAFRDVSPYSEWCHVAYIAPTRSQAEERITQINDNVDEKVIIVEHPIIADTSGECAGDVEVDEINMADLL